MVVYHREAALCEMCSLTEGWQTPTTLQGIQHPVDVNEVFASILENVGRVAPNDAANIMLIEGPNAVVRACKGYEAFGGKDTVLGQSRRLVDVPNLARMAQTGQPIHITATSLSPDWISFQHSSWIQSYASAPICRAGRTLGFLNLNSSRPNFYTDEHAQLLRAFADQAAIAIENTRLYLLAQAEIVERIKAEQDLQKAKDELEARVEQRTQELNRAIEHLKRELQRRKQAEEALERERALLELRIEERTAELSSANTELARAAQMKDSFLANMSHELRTPLNAILNISETLQENIYGSLNDKQQHLTHTIEESGRHLLALINDILDLSKIGAGKLELVWDTLHVQEVCESSLKIIREAAAKKNLVVTTCYDPDVKWMRADQRRVKQILVNLLNNAVKFTPQGGAIGLTVKGDVEREQVLFTVWDRGIGIARQDLSALFKPFTQLDHGLSRQFDGTGLGLALVYHLVELHGGSLQVETALGSGSVFTVSLNWKFSQHEAAPSPAPQTAGLLTRSPRQDASTNTDTLKEYLEEMGIEVTTCWTENNLVEIPAKTSTTLLFLDLPSAGLEKQWVQALAQQGASERITTILLTRDHHREAQNALPKQAGYLSYPFTRQDLRGAIKRLSPAGTVSLLNKAVLVRERNYSLANGAFTILVVDDNEVSVRAMCDYLEARGFRTTRAYNGVEAIRRTQEVKPSLILMDIQMPGMDGLEAIQRIRADEHIQSIPVIALTALAMPGDRDRCLEAGANNYLSKPLSLKNLVEVIGQYLRKN